MVDALSSSLQRSGLIGEYTGGLAISLSLDRRARPIFCENRLRARYGDFCFFWAGSASPGFPSNRKVFFFGARAPFEPDFFPLGALAHYFLGSLCIDLLPVDEEVRFSDWPFRGRLCVR